MHYPVVILFEELTEQFTLSVVDLPGCKVTNHSIDHGLLKLKEEIAGHLKILAEYGEQIPHAKSIDFHRKNSTNPMAIWALVEFDIVPYLGKSHKINVTLPELLIKQIDDRVSKDENYKTRSGFIATSCIEQLNKK
ncbi:type II toxin-antitoxin system HicB family antitoxin [Thalassotalea sp. PLHSN55]|uniref:type II toxin-antitoxin system HicB family antitoxin n=1 Tax=Thalassotalea sp. PLHSN55 TaxID=3435888 RepID=UPI003F846F58